MWAAFHGRASAYAGAWEVAEGLDQVLSRNIWRGTAPPDGAAAALCRLAHAQDRALTAQDLAALRQGQVRFLPAEEASA